MTLNADRQADLERVNTSLNASIKPITDQKQYGVPEYWEVADKAGDCEDYALAKRKALRALGWLLETLDIAVCRTQTGEAHAVLIAHTDQGDMVLDNLMDRIERWDHAGYHWIMVSVDGSLKNWRSLEAGSAA
jgi:predicted transglutaminase-like cysteine proteinase